MKDRFLVRSVVGNIAVVTLLLTATYSIFDYYSQPNKMARQGEIKPGERISIDQFDFGGGQNTLLLALSTSCGYCADSTELYKKIARINHSTKRVRLVAGFFQDRDTGRRFCNEYGFAVEEIIQISESRPAIVATPAVFHVSSDGVVMGAWYGRLSRQEEIEAINSIFGSSGLD